MVIEICLAIIATTLVGLVIVLVRISAQIQESIHQVQLDVNRISTETSRLSSSLNEFVSSDLHRISEGADALLGKITDLTSDINNKSRSLSFLFKPFSFLNSKTSLDSSSSSDLSSQGETIPKILNWIVASVLLIKTTKEFVKKL